MADLFIFVLPPSSLVQSTDELVPGGFLQIRASKLVRIQKKTVISGHFSLWTDICLCLESVMIHEQWQYFVT